VSWVNPEAVLSEGWVVALGLEREGCVIGGSWGGPGDEACPRGLVFDDEIVMGIQVPDEERLPCVVGAADDERASKLGF